MDQDDRGLLLVGVADRFVEIEFQILPRSAVGDPPLAVDHPVGPLDIPVGSFVGSRSGPRHQKRYPEKDSPPKTPKNVSQHCHF